MVVLGTFRKPVGTELIVHEGKPLVLLDLGQRHGEIDALDLKVNTLCERATVLRGEGQIETKEEARAQVSNKVKAFLNHVSFTSSRLEEYGPTLELTDAQGLADKVKLAPIAGAKGAQSRLREGVRG